MEIWPAGIQSGGHVVQGDKVANVDWDAHGNIDIITFKSGVWEQQLLDLLQHPTKVEFLPRR